MFERGSTILQREVWGERVWLTLPSRVVCDGDVLATLVEDGAPFTFDDDADPPHPWAGRSSWNGASVLQLRRAGDWYSVWLFLDGGALDHWYVNFERPYARRPDGIDTDDLELDLVVTPDGERRWKDVEDLHARLAEGRFAVDDLVRVLAEAEVVADLLDRDERWWAPWDDWTPSAPTPPPRDSP